MKKETPLEKLYDLLTDWQYGSRRPRNFRLLLFNQLKWIFNDLNSEGKSEFVSDDVIPYLKKCGIKVEPVKDDICYVAYL